MATLFCRHCGSPNAGTRFCENCGQPAEFPAAPVIAPAGYAAPPPYRYTPVAAAGTQRSSPLHIVTLVSYLAYLVVPIFARLALANLNFYSGFQGWYTFVDVLTIGLLVICGGSATVAGFISHMSPNRRVGGGMLGVFVVLISLLMFIPGIGGYVNIVGQLLIPAALFLSWAIVRPLRAPGYFALLIWVALAGITFAIQFLPFLRYDYVMWSVVYLLMTVITVVATVIVALAFEKLQPGVAPRAVAPAYAQAQAGYPAYYGPRTNTLAVVSLVFGIAGGSLVAVILGHIAKGQIRRTGEMGSGMATAGLILGYFWLVILLIFVVIQVVGLVMFSSAMSLYGY